MRLNKFLAECGVASRRAADAFIASGRVSIDGRRASLGATVNPDANDVTVDGSRLRLPRSDHLTLALNKPAGVVTTMHDEHGRPTVAELLPAGRRRLFPVGRLDADTTGLLLCTSDGALAKFLMHPSSRVPRCYEVVARGALDETSARKLGAKNVRRLADGSHRFSIVLTEGKNRQVRRMCAARGLRVLALARTQYGPIHLGALQPGRTRALTKSELQTLRQMQQRSGGPSGPPPGKRLASDHRKG